jgi:hypothetical protein
MNLVLLENTLDLVSYTHLFRIYYFTYFIQLLHLRGLLPHQLRPWLQLCPLSWLQLCPPFWLQLFPLSLHL